MHVANNSWESSNLYSGNEHTFGARQNLLWCDEHETALEDSLMVHLTTLSQRASQLLLNLADWEFMSKALCLASCKFDLYKHPFKRARNEEVRQDCRNLVLQRY